MNRRIPLFFIGEIPYLSHVVRLVINQRRRTYMYIYICVCVYIGGWGVSPLGTPTGKSISVSSSCTCRACERSCARGFRCSWGRPNFFLLLLLLLLGRADVPGRPAGRPAGRRVGRPAGRRVWRLAGCRAGRRAWRILGRPGTSRGKKLPAALHGSRDVARDVARGVSWDVPGRPVEKINACGAPM